jgi:alkylation response protein AidB-like acyl-CoA dehydrogenase
VSLRDRIAAKTRRTATLPLAVGDVAGAAAAVATLQAALDVHMAAVRERVAGGEEEADADRQRATELRAQLASARSRQVDTVALVELLALTSDQWEAVVSTARRDEDGDIDLEDVLGELLAASCTDADLQDAAWWTEQLHRPEYTRGDRLAIVNSLIALNLHTPDGRQGKG